MGRKLNPYEEAQSALMDRGTDRHGDRDRIGRHFMERIADQLGITSAEMGDHPAPPNGVQPAIDPVRRDELVLTQQCADLVKAFVQITDLKDRLRYLQIVRDAVPRT